MASCRHPNWVEVSDVTACRVIDSGRLGRLVKDLRDPTAQFPQTLVCVGGDTKKRAIDALFPDHNPTRNRRRQGLTDLYIDPSRVRQQYPIFFVDCSLEAPVPIRTESPKGHEKVSFDTAWQMTAGNRKEIILTRVIFPFTDVIAIFADDFSGLDVVFSLLQRWNQSEAASTLPWRAQPRICVIAASPSTSDELLQQRAFQTRLRELRPSRHFSSIRLVCLPREASGNQYLRRILLEDELGIARQNRQSERVLFAAHHLSSFFTRAVAHVATSVREPFDFVRASRIYRPLPVGFGEQTSLFLRIAREHHFPDDDTVAIVASSVLLDAFPPGSHRECDTKS